MKKYYFLLIIISSFFIISCEKADTEVKLPGYWELSVVQGGMIAGYVHPTGKGYGIKFTDTEYEKYENGQISKSGMYSIVREKSSINGEIMDRIIYDNNLTGSKQFIDIKNSSLTIYWGTIAADGLIYKYQKTGLD